MPRLALNRKDTGWRIDWQEALYIAARAGLPAAFPASLA